MPELLVAGLDETAWMSDVSGWVSDDVDDDATTANSETLPWPSDSDLTSDKSDGVIELDTDDDDLIETTPDFIEGSSTHTPTVPVLAKCKSKSQARLNPFARSKVPQTKGRINSD